MHYWSKFGDSNLNKWKVIVRTSSKWGKIRLSSYIWPWRSKSITPKNYRHLNQGVLRLSSKFSDSSVNGWWVIVRTSKWLIHTHRHTDKHTDAGDYNTRRPKLASGKKLNICSWWSGDTGRLCSDRSIFTMLHRANNTESFSLLWCYHMMTLLWHAHLQGPGPLTNLSLDNLAGKLQTTFSNAFSSMGMSKFR